MILAVVVLMGMASGQRVAKSMHVNKNLNPPLANDQNSGYSFKGNCYHFSQLHFILFGVALIYPLALITFPNMIQTVFCDRWTVKEWFDQLHHFISALMTKMIMSKCQTLLSVLGW